MTSLNLGIVNINNSQIENYSIAEIKASIVQFLENDFNLKEIKRKNRWKRIDKELRNLKVVDKESGDRLREALTSLGEGVEVGDYKKARDEYLDERYGL